MPRPEKKTFGVGSRGNMAAHVDVSVDVRGCSLIAAVGFGSSLRVKAYTEEKEECVSSWLRILEPFGC